MSRKLRELTALPVDELVPLFQEFVDTFDRARRFVDVYFERVSSTSIRKTRTSENVVQMPQKGGVAVRTFGGGKWHEFALQEVDGIEKTRDRIARLPQGAGEDLSELPGWQCDEVLEVDRPPLATPVVEKVNRTRELSAAVEGSDKRVVNPVVFYSDLTSEKIVVNNEGSVLRQVIPQTRLFLKPVVKEGDRQAFDYYSIGKQAGFELLEEISPAVVETVVQQSVEMLSAEAAPAGKMPVVLDGDMAGLIAHESFGHGLEADQVLRERSYLTNHFQDVVASPVVHISDSPAVPRARGSFYFDDEGVRATKTALVKDGRLVNYLHDRYSASALDATPGGNGRRESFTCRVNARMTNTFFEQGDHAREELFEGISRGVLLEHGYFGMEDPLGGGIQCTSKKGWLIEHGRKTTLLGAVTLSGFVLDLLKSIDAVGKNALALHPGTCGKGTEDFVPVTSGGPYLRAQSAIVGPG